MPFFGFARTLRRPELLWVAGLAVGCAGVTFALATLNTTLVDFFGPGTQPETIIDPIYSAQDCGGCHGGFNEEHEPFTRWAASMMGQSARDPLFHACLAIANQDAAFAGDLCLRCHTPGAWLEGRSVPTDGSALNNQDFEGVTCHACHRMVDPIHTPGVDPYEDQQILAGLTNPPVNAHSGHYVIDPLDRRRGPFDLGKFFFHEWLESPFHQSSTMCATCHDVSNPVYTRQPNGVYALNALNAPHPTHNKFDQFPIERTFSEWSQSAFALGPIEMGGRFGGNLSAVSSCQDCHMPDTSGTACSFGGEFRNDLPQHDFNGGNTWVLQAVHNLYDPGATFLTDDSVADSIERAKEMLRRASDLELSVAGPSLNVRVINQGGHKLPTGYPEGRRMWVNVRFFNGSGGLIAERGAYNAATATLSTADTKVYEAKLGVDAAVAALTGVPEGPGFHFALNNTWFKDNRIPPRGFTNAGFASVQAAPVAYSYADGQYWDDTQYPIPPGAASAHVAVYYQTSSREYIEFLRDMNTTNTAGQVAYDQWVATGRSAPAPMDLGTISLVTCRPDINMDGMLNVQDFLAFLSAYAAGLPVADFNADGVVNVQDFLAFLTAYAAGCA